MHPLMCVKHTRICIRVQLHAGPDLSLRTYDCMVITGPGRLLGLDGQRKDAPQVSPCVRAWRACVRACVRVHTHACLRVTTEIDALR